MLRAYWLVGLMLVTHASALANDSTASLAAGGLVLEETDEIAMREEDLLISEDEVVVRYVFENVTDEDVTTIVAFPMPLVQASYDGDVSIPTGDRDRPIDFETMVEGESVAMSVERRALKDGNDITDRLASFDVPPTLTSEATAQAIAGLTIEAKKALLDEGLLRQTQFGGDTVWSDHLAPDWSLKTTYYWEQRFPAGRTLSIEHRYSPSVSRSLDNVFNYGDEDDIARTRAEYCVDDEFMAAVAERGASEFFERNLGYVLTTGGNWAGPIGRFTLTVDKGAEHVLVSFCGKEESEKTGPRTYRLSRTDYVPERDLSILILWSSPD